MYLLLNYTPCIIYLAPDLGSRILCHICLSVSLKLLVLDFSNSFAKTHFEQNYVLIRSSDLVQVFHLHTSVLFD